MKTFKQNTINTGKKPKYIENYCETKDLQQKKERKKERKKEKKLLNQYFKNPNDVF